MRTAEIIRKTAETDITLELSLDGSGIADVKTGCGFLDHMLTLLASHGNFDLKVRCQGDTDVDFHHSVEDVGICLGQAFAKAIGEAKGITRYGSMLLPMDEALILCAVDISGREHLSFGLNIPAEKIGEFDTELAEEFFCALVRHAKICLHLQQLAGKNSHHLIEGAFKAFAHAMETAVRIDTEHAQKIPSSKGMLL
ncbi:MAG: imidazoleglycerol-phosphate dehydratase HisB [Ruminococcaceae bacterium]|nr:imidazoleglycerol-phosphate dehydratase HisB [Oscillospiraceae bacterium]